MAKKPPPPSRRSSNNSPRRNSKPQATSPAERPPQPAGHTPSADLRPPHKPHPKAVAPSPKGKKKSCPEAAFSEFSPAEDPSSPRHRLPDLQTVLDAFDPMDQDFEPEPEPGDFWIPPEEFDG